MLDYRREKGRTEAQSTINEIYDQKLYKMLNESALGLTGSRGRRIAQNNFNKKQQIIAKVL